jgi:phage tail protein X
MAGSGFLTHVTTDGDRWDLLANRYYGDPYRYVPIVEANPDVPLYPVLPAGLTIYVPILADDAALVDLPPWKVLA